MSPHRSTPPEDPRYEFLDAALRKALVPPRLSQDFQARLDARLTSAKTHTKALGKLGNGSLIFVPGMMGTELRLMDRGKGIPGNSLVWGEDFPEVLWTLSRRPELLVSPDLVATCVIREIRVGRFKVRKVYGPLLDFCTSQSGLGLTQDRSFYTFPYDWRQDLSKTATHLAALVDRVPAPVFILVHSVGGIITRMMLDQDARAAERVRGVFEIACPISGSGTAFTTLRRRPTLGSISTWVWPLFHGGDQDRRARLIDALGTMHSISQLLPPAQEEILLPSGGIKRSASDAFWGRVYSAQLPADWLPPVGNSAPYTRLSSRTDVHKALRRFLS